MKKPRRPKTHFVPTVVFRTAFAGVVPICVAGIACGGNGGSGDGGTGNYGVGVAFNGPDATDAPFNGSVGCAGFACMGVGVQAFADGGDAPAFSVALIGFDGAAKDATAKDAAADASRTDGSAGPCPGGGFACLGVAVAAFADGGDSG